MSDRIIGTGLQPIIKWPGGKEKELKYIIPNIPPFRRYFEPFVGGGAVFMGVSADEYYINDLSSELIDLYGNIRNAEPRFFDYVSRIDASWVRCTALLGDGELAGIYSDYRTLAISKDQLKAAVARYFRRNTETVAAIIDRDFAAFGDVLVKELNTNVFRKMTRMHELEQTKHELPRKDIDNIEAAIKSALYMTYRAMYNDRALIMADRALHCALFFFIRNYAYSGMFRYSSKGDFNVPYGGIAYNSKLLSKKTAYYRSEAVAHRFAASHIFNLDFEDFLNRVRPGADDFVFLDPPYDSEFSTYARNDFTKDDQRRLAAYLIDRCPARWMLVIKNTDFIYGLYNQPGINIMSFDKKYMVSFMNRNDKNVTHLIITNYTPT